MTVILDPKSFHLSLERGLRHKTHLYYCRQPPKILPNIRDTIFLKVSFINILTAVINNVNTLKIYFNLTSVYNRKSESHCGS